MSVGESQMRLNTWKSTIAAGLLIGLGTGCSSMHNQTVRGQSPEAQLLVHEEGWKATQGEIQQVGRVDPPLEGEIKGAIQNELYGDMTTQHRYRSGVQGELVNPGFPAPGMVAGPRGRSPYAGYGGFDTQPCPAGPYAGFHNAPPSHQEQGWDYGGRQHRGVYNYHTYTYQEPRGLSYPAPNQPGGAVTYPYYTHKGPSDFFYQGDTK